MKRFFASLAMAAALLVGGSAFAQIKVDETLPAYKPVAGVSGNIKSVGSDTMNNLMANWVEGFCKFYPNVNKEIEGKGSGTAVPALIGGTATFGPMSRPMKPSEIDEFEKKFGYPPTALGTSVDMLAVYVHKDNPIKELSLAQVDSIFSSTRKLGGSADIRTWGQVGLKGAYAEAPISQYGRNSASGTYGFFKEHVMGGGDFKNGIKEQAGSTAVVQAVASDKFAIGYSGIGAKTADVNALPLTSGDGKAAVSPGIEHAYDGAYPLTRLLYVYVNVKPGQPLDPLRREFIKYVFSKQGQEDVVKDGYYPVNAKLATKALVAAGIQAAQTKKPATVGSK